MNGGVLFVSGDGSVYIENNKFRGNRANNGGNFYLSSLKSVEMTGNEF